MTALELLDAFVAGLHLPPDRARGLSALIEAAVRETLGTEREACLAIIREVMQSELVMTAERPTAYNALEWATLRIRARGGPGQEEST